METKTRDFTGYEYKDITILGTGGILIPWGIVLLLIGNTPLGIGILILYGIIMVVRNIIEPKLVGKQIGLHPIVTLISMFCGLNLFGVMGMFVTPVVVAVIVNMKGASNI